MNRTFSKLILLITLLAVALLLTADNARAGFIIRGPAYLGLQNGLVGCWTLDGSFTAAQDCSNNNNTGTLTNGPVKTIGKLGQALDFDGSNDYVDVGEGSGVFDFAVQSYTLSVWMLNHDGAAHENFFEKRDGNNGFEMRMDNDSSGGIEILAVTDASNFLRKDTQTTYNDGQWHHVVAVITTTDGEIYVDGVNQTLDDTSAGTYTGTTDNNDSLLIGTRNASDGYFDGLLDDMRIFDRALSATEIERMYKIGLGSKGNSTLYYNQFDDGLVGHWTFDGPDVSGTVAKDRSGNGHNGTLSGGPVQAIGKIGQALDFDGDDDYVELGSIDASDPLALAGSDVTISVWVNLTSGGDTFPRIIDKSSGGSAADGWAFLYDEAGDNWEFHADGVQRVGTVAGATTDEWVHLVVTMNATTGVIYENAIAQSLATNAPAFAPATTANARIGSWNHADAREWDGKLDDVRVYNRALSASEVARMYTATRSAYNTTLTSLDDGLLGHWTFDGPDVSGIVAKDRSGNVNNGTLTNGPVKAIGRIGQAIEFDGTNYIDITNGSAYIDPNVAFTMGGWVYLRSYDDTWPAIMVLTTTEANRAFLFFMSDHGSYDTFGFGSQSGTWSNLRWNDTPNNHLNVWTHIIITYNGSGAATDGNYSMYLNGAEVTLTDIGGSLGDNNDEVSRIGASGLSTDDWDGFLDDIRLYNRELSAGEVNKLYQRGR